MHELLGAVAVWRGADMTGMILFPIIESNKTKRTLHFLRAYKMDNYETVIITRSVNVSKQASAEGSVEMVTDI